GAFSNLDWDNAQRMPASFRKDFRVIAERDSVPRAIELARADLPPALLDALRMVLLNIDQDASADAALRGYFATARFEAIDVETRRSLTALNARIAPLRRELDR
ncbi:MAG TPA: PhnD/SsuA/transferrin family substrate-binding protein, partial [Patescibacteria group bacterium]|nr:PhnD/SsuA/transferrin family substrate-binding protein [Patescibacteria group bacterium]